MSGGKFGYDQYRIGYIADEIQAQIDRNDSQELNEWGDRIGGGWRPEVIEQFQAAVRALRVAQVYAHRADWLLSGDDGPESFLERTLDDLAKLKP